MRSNIQDNWYSSVDSPTYNLTLYITSADVFDSPKQLATNETAVLNSGRAKIIAASGRTTNFLIDNLAMVSTVRAATDTANVTTGALNFEIQEPLGFSLMHKLMALSDTYKFMNIQNALYVLKVQFKGLVPGTATAKKYPDEFLFRLKLTNLEANVGPEGARYQVSANMATVDSVQHTSIEQDITWKGVSTVNDYVSKLEAALNEHEKNIKRENSSETAVQGRYWKINLTPEFKTQFGNSLMKGQDPRSSGTSSTDSTNTQSYSLAPSSNVVSEIRTRLSEVPAITEYNEKRKPTEPRKDVEVIPNYTHKMNGIVPEMDPKTNQPIRKMEITVGLRKTFDRPDLENPQDEIEHRRNPRSQAELLNNMSPFIFKRYDYLFTGHNTEILDFDLSYDFQYFLNKHVSFGSGFTDAAEVMQPTEVQSQQIKLSSPFLGALKVKSDMFGVTVPVYEFTTTSTSQQRTNETTGDRKAAEARDRLESMTNDKNQNINLTIKGDPFWMGNPDSQSLGTNNNAEQSKFGDTMIMVINFLPDESLADANIQYKPIVDISISGIYVITQITTRFQNGKFIQQLEGVKKPDLTTALVQHQLLGIKGGFIGPAPTSTSSNNNTSTSSNNTSTTSTNTGGSGATASGDQGDGLRGGSSTTTDTTTNNNQVDPNISGGIS